MGVGGTGPGPNGRVSFEPVCIDSRGVIMYPILHPCKVICLPTYLAHFLWFSCTLPETNMAPENGGFQ